MASCTLEGYQSLYHTDPPYYSDYTERLYGYDSECPPVEYSIPAMEAICRSSSDAVPSQELPYGDVLSISSVLPRMTAVRDASYASNKYPSTQ